VEWINWCVVENKIDKMIRINVAKNDSYRESNATKWIFQSALLLRALLFATRSFFYFVYFYVIPSSPNINKKIGAIDGYSVEY
jgi:hypothetical protein